MRTLFVFAVLLSLMILSGAAGAGSVITTKLYVKNMTCGLCPITVKKALMGIHGVSSADTELKSRTATIQYDPNLTNTETLIQATTNAGYPATVKK